ncbi:MAG: tetratricopeptide repeat protein [Rhodobacteraceae bacterium]|nr:tetratricopeptide repeat protein [Paracoccaceae bacterium]
MGAPARYLNRVVAASLAIWLVGVPVLAASQVQAPDQAQELRDLKSDDYSTWRKAESDLTRQWASSGSPALDLLLERGRAAIDAGDFRAAAEHLTALIDHAPDFAEAYNLRAEAYYRAGLFGPAIEDIGKTLSLNPNEFDALAGLGAILEAVGKPKDALAAYRMATAIHPHLPTVLDAIKRLATTAGQEL